MKRLIFGAMSLGGEWNKEPLTSDVIEQDFAAIQTAIECGMTRFDHANIYKLGKSEEVFGLYLQEHQGLREKIDIQSKVGIHIHGGERANTYNFSYDHILSEVEGILSRLQTDYIDTLLFHRPDALADRHEMKRAVDYLFDNGMIREMGVSNMNWHQIQLYQHYLERPLCANQLEMSLQKRDWVESGFVVNHRDAMNLDFTNGTVEQCMLHGIELQAWSPLAQGIYSGRPFTEDTSDAVRHTSALVATLAEQKGVSKEAIVLSWLMTHPAQIAPVIGTSNPERIRQCAEAVRVTLTRDEWYDVLICARGNILP